MRKCGNSKVRKCENAKMAGLPLRHAVRATSPKQGRSTLGLMV